MGLLVLAATEKNKNRTLLEKHLTDYVSKNSFDYFIHKDLGDFLRHELDFYIKNEVLFIDDISSRSPEEFVAYLTQVKTIKAVGDKLITFLAQLEDFQKKLWLKKKFVVETNYCITLDRVPEELYTDIIANDAQREEWVRLFAIDEIEGSGSKKDIFNTGTSGYSIPLTFDFLKENPFLVLDTAFFDDNFKQRLISSIDNFEDQLDGTLINSENFQALNILQKKYRQQVKCIYIDPPYNAKSSEIAYKNTFKHSSWNSLIFDRVKYGYNLLSENGVFEFAIDDYEVHNSTHLIGQIFGNNNFMGNICVQHNPRGRNDDKFFGTSHEYMTVFAKDADSAEVGLFNLSDSDIASYKKTDGISNYSTVPYTRTGNNSRRFERPNLFYSIYVNPETLKLSLEYIEGWHEVLPIAADGEEKTWRWGQDPFLSK